MEKLWKDIEKSSQKGGKNEDKTIPKSMSNFVMKKRSFSGRAWTLAGPPGRYKSTRLPVGNLQKKKTIEKKL